MYWASPGVINKPFWAGALIRSSTAIIVISLLYICKIHDMFTAQLTIGVSPFSVKTGQILCFTFCGFII